MDSDPHRPHLSQVVGPVADVSAVVHVDPAVHALSVDVTPEQVAVRLLGSGTVRVP